MTWALPCNTNADIVSKDKKRYGGKAANLSAMHAMNLVVPNAIVSPTINTFRLDDLPQHKVGYYFMQDLISRLRYGYQQSRMWGKTLTVSVRSGAPVSMPGMMDTILNIGLSKENLTAFANSYNADMSFAYDCYRRLVSMFGTTVHGIPASEFNSHWNDLQEFFLGDVPEFEMQKAIAQFEQVYEDHVGDYFPQDTNVQLEMAIRSVYESWNTDRAIEYRNIEGIDHNMGTACIVQNMVYGNLPDSATGVVFTHDPNTGEQGMCGEYLVNAQGEDVVAGTHTPRDINDIDSPVIQNCINQLRSNLDIISKQDKDAPDIYDVEFTIERGKLYMLQYRSAKTSSRARVAATLGFARTGTLTDLEAADRILVSLGHTQQQADKGNVLTVGVGATHGVVTGRVAVSHEQAAEFAAQNIDYIYVAHETAVDDVKPMSGAVGILTRLGGVMSHAALVARSWDKACVVGCKNIGLEPNGIRVDGKTYETITIDGETGEVCMYE